MCSLVPSKSAGALAASATAVGGASTSGSGSTSTSATGGNSSSVGDDIVAYTWYAGWHGTEFPPEKLSWNKYTAVTYAFA